MDVPVARNCVIGRLRVVRCPPAAHAVGPTTRRYEDGDMTRVLLAEDDQVKMRVIEFFKQVLNRTARMQPESQPGKPVARSRRVFRQFRKRNGQRTASIMNAGLRDNAEGKPLDGGAAHGETRLGRARATRMRLIKGEDDCHPCSARFRSEW